MTWFYLLLQRLVLGLLQFFIDWSDEGLEIHEILWHSFLSLPLMYLDFSLVLFAACCYAAASSLNSIQEEIRRLHAIKIMSPLFAWHCLRKWKRSHALVCDTVIAIGDCFGPILVLSVSFIFIRLIFLFVKEFKFMIVSDFPVELALSWLNVAHLISLFSIPCILVDHLRFKVFLFLRRYH